MVRNTVIFWDERGNNGSWEKGVLLCHLQDDIQEKGKQVYAFIQACVCASPSSLKLVKQAPRGKVIFSPYLAKFWKLSVI